MGNKVLRIKIGNETRPVVERYDKSRMNDMFFTEQYHSAFNAIEGYLRNLEKRKSENAASSARDSKNIWIENDNNIFTFSGDRGSGKTLCMISVAIALVEKIYKFYKLDGKHDYDFRMISPKQESPLNISDPSFFDESHNIIQLIIAQMFKAFDNKRTEDIKCGDDDEKDAQRSKLLDQFRIVHKSLVQQTKKFNAEIPEDGIEMFSCYAASINLREEISELVKRFLAYMYGEEDAILVLPIDDIDLNSTQAVGMMELIRKYLISENILILMAVKLEQLTMLKCQQNIKDNKNLLDKGKIHLDDIDTMTERYISKLLPLSQRVYMPVAEVWHESKLEITPAQKSEGKIEYNTVKEGVLSLIYKKTHYLFYNSDIHTCYLVPRNLRELRQVIRLLVGMDEIDRQHNQTIFKEYLFETWAENHLYTEDKFRINKLFNLNDAVRFNALALEQIREKFPTIQSTRTENTINPADKQFNQITQKDDPEMYELYHILNPTNKVYNISLGDVMGVIGILEQQETDEKNLKFLFLLKALYSIRLYDYYKELEDTNGQESQNDSNNEITLTSTFKSDISKTNYHRLVGGRFINYRLYDVLPSEGGEKSRTTRMINGKVLFNELKDVCKIIQKAANKDNNDNDKIHEKIIRGRII